MKTFKHLVAFALVICMLLSCGCYRKRDKYEMVDRTDKSQCAFDTTVLTFEEVYHETMAKRCDSFFQLLNPKAYALNLEYGKINDSNDLIRVAEYALKDCLGSDYIDMGSVGSYFKYTEEGINGEPVVAYYCGGETYVIVEKDTGKLLFCADIRLNANIIPPETLNSDVIWRNIGYATNLCDATIEELNFFNQIVGYGFNQNKPEPETPITDVTTAFDYAVKLIKSDHFLERYSAKWIGIYYNESLGVWIAENGHTYLTFDNDGKNLNIFRS